MRLTYCGNVHPAESLADWLSAHERFAMPIAMHRRAFGLGAWWPRPLVQELLEQPERVQALRDMLAGVPVWTCNAFPVGPFHSDGIKDSVYLPAWGDPDRLRYTAGVGEIGARLAEVGTVLAVSTVPLGPVRPDRSRHDQAAAQHLLEIAKTFEDLSQETGVDVVLALEPEPCARFERIAEASAWLESVLLAEFPDDEQLLRRRIGLCSDLCHAAVVGEDPVASFRDARARGFRVPKVQVSSCPEARGIGGLRRLLSFEEGRYLHQTFAPSAGLRALDLDEARARRSEFEAALGSGVVRTHFHVPLFWDESGDFGSTQSEVVRALPEIVRDVAVHGDEPLFEVETYTWGVLPDDLRPDSDAGLIAGIERELAFVDDLVGG